MGKIVHKVHCNAEILHGVQDFSLVSGENCVCYGCVSCVL